MVNYKNKSKMKNMTSSNQEKLKVSINKMVNQNNRSKKMMKLRKRLKQKQRPEERKKNSPSMISKRLEQNTKHKIQT